MSKPETREETQELARAIALTEELLGWEDNPYANKIYSIRGGYLLDDEHGDSVTVWLYIGNLNHGSPPIQAVREVFYKLDGRSTGEADSVPWPQRTGRFAGRVSTISEISGIGGAGQRIKVGVRYDRYVLKQIKINNRYLMACGADWDPISDRTAMDE